MLKTYRLLGFACLFIGLALVLQQPTAAAPDGSKTSTKTVAILSFDNNSNEVRYDHLGKGLADMMITDLSAVEALQLVERERLQELVDELELQQSALFDPETALKLGRFVGAEYVVIGSLTSVKPTLRIDARVIHVESSEIVQSSEVTGEEDEFFEMHQELADQLIAGVDVWLSPEEREILRQQQEANRLNELETALAYSEALYYYDQEDYVRAFEKMQVVQESAPNSVIAKITYDKVKDKAQRETEKKVREKVNKGLKKLFKG